MNIISVIEIHLFDTSDNRLAILYANPRFVYHLQSMTGLPGGYQSALGCKRILIGGVIRSYVDSLCT